MAVNYIRATKDNLDMGRIVIQCTSDGQIFGPLMICASKKSQIKKKPIIQCYYHTNNPQAGKMVELKELDISELAKVIDHHTKRKLKHEEKF